MNEFEVFLMRNSSILRIYSQKEIIQVDPEYQRMGEVWTIEKRQLLIDSILNDFDIPKIYLHEFSKPKELKDGRRVKYAVIDGRQRLETIWSFIENKFTLETGFNLYADPSIKASGLTYNDLSKTYPTLKTALDSFTLPIIIVRTEDIEMIEEMFSRLNEAVPLNAAEKRNAFGGVMAKTIRDVSASKLFKEKISFSNRRYQHREVAARFLFLLFSIKELDKIIDTKKAYLDDFVKKFKRKKLNAQKLKKEVLDVLDKMNKVFIKRDPLLKAQSMVVIYFMVFKESCEENWDNLISRKRLLEFNEHRTINRIVAEKNLSNASYALLEFDRMAQQGTNDGVSIRYRTDTLKEFLKVNKLR